MSFVNTVDIIGDKALTNSIIDGSITEIADDNAESLGEYAFYACSSLTKADFLAVRKINGYAFYSCSALTALVLRSATKVTLSNTNALNSTAIANGTGYIYVPGALLESYKADSKWSTYANQFRILEDYTVDGTVTGEVDPNRCRVRFYNDDGTFLGYVMVSNGGTAVYPGDEPVKEGDWAFKGWNPAPTNVTADMDCYAQFKSTAIVSRKIVDHTISGDYVNNSVTSIGKYVFYTCSNLTSVVFSKATSVADEAFRLSYNLTTVDFHSVTSIGAMAFQQCTNLSTLILRADSVCTLGASVFYGCKFNSTGYIYVPAALVDSYKVASRWSEFASNIRAIEDYPDICGGE